MIESLITWEQAQKYTETIAGEMPALPVIEECRVEFLD